MSEVFAVRHLYYDRQGQPITLHEWAAKMNDDAYKRVAITECAGVMVSTVWLGLDHSFGSTGPPVIFETMVFASENAPEALAASDGEEWRYATEAEAMEGHRAVVARLFPEAMGWLNASEALGRSSADLP